MAWTTPKTNWVATDYFNKEDYNRIVDNLLYLQSIVYHLFDTPKYETMAQNKNYSDLIYASEFNAIENNLDALNKGTYKASIGNKASYSANGLTPNYVEFNRIENACLLLYNKLEGNIECLPRFSSRLGNMKGIRV